MENINSNADVGSYCFEPMSRFFLIVEIIFNVLNKNSTMVTSKFRLRQAICINWKVPQITSNFRIVGTRMTVSQRKTESNSKKPIEVESFQHMINKKEAIF